MKTVGIKLADGSFYPVMEEGSVQTKTLDLTTAHNNQTCVMVDLYRSASCTMEDAAYIDTLKIENLAAHPNGEPDITFCVSLDENNQLSAKILDEETGAQSNTQISLISRTEEERLQADDYQISNSTRAAAFTGALATGAGLLATAEAIRERGFANDFDGLTKEVPPADDINMTQKDNVEFDAGQTGDLGMNLPDLGDLTSSALADTGDSLSDFDTAEFDEPAGDDTLVATDLDLPDFEMEDDPSFTKLEDDADDTFSLDDSTTSGADIIDTEDSLPDFDMAELTEPSVAALDAAEDSPLPDFDTAEFDEPAGSDNTLVAADLDLPDFDDSEISDDLDFPSLDDSVASGVTRQAAAAAFATDLDLPDFDDNQEDSLEDEALDDSDPFNFSGLYDEETKRGEAASHSEESSPKRTRVPMIICIICAIICILAVLALLIIPSRYNLISRHAAKATEPEPVIQARPVETESPKNQAVQLDVPPVEPVPQEETKIPEQKAPPALEDEIVIIEEAELVEPLPPPVEEKKPEPVRYKIKWGDTLWDLADTYYKNPWKYKYIARYNGIKNPDKIVSGTVIIIPAE